MSSLTQTYLLTAHNSTTLPLTGLGTITQKFVVQRLNSLVANQIPALLKQLAIYGSMFSHLQL